MIGTPFEPFLTLKPVKREAHTHLVIKNAVYGDLANNAVVNVTQKAVDWIEDVWSTALNTVIVDFDEVLWTASLNFVIVPRWIGIRKGNLREDSENAKSEDDSLCE